jgi:hypothetical protein
VRFLSLDVRIRDMLQQATTIQSPDVLTELERAQAQAAQLRVKAADLDARKSVLADRRAHANSAERERLDKAWLDAQHDFNVAYGQLDAANARVERLEKASTPVVVSVNPGPAPSPKVATIAKPPEPLIGPGEIMDVWWGGVLLLFPFVLVLARRLWVRGRRREAFDPENSPRLQRIEQAVESIALEVERIGEAQRFTSKLLADRQSDVAQRIAVQPRREPGTITPH